MNRPQTLADRIGARVTYRGQNIRKQHMFCNGTALVTDIFPTLPAGVARFGKRIEIDEKNLRFSTIFQQGYEDAKKGIFFIRDAAEQQERLEYGSGQLKFLLEPAPVVTPPMKATPLPVETKPIVMPEPKQEPAASTTWGNPPAVEPPPPPRKRGRPKGSGKKQAPVIDIE